jgi:hypothetical protein
VGLIGFGGRVRSALARDVFAPRRAELSYAVAQAVGERPRKPISAQTEGAITAAEYSHRGSTRWNSKTPWNWPAHKIDRRRLPLRTATTRPTHDVVRRSQGKAVSGVRKTARAHRWRGARAPEAARTLSAARAAPRRRDNGRLGHLESTHNRDCDEARHGWGSEYRSDREVVVLEQIAGARTTL